MILDNEYFSFKKLIWDTENFDIDTYELVLKKDLQYQYIQELHFLYDVKGLIYIKNSTQNRENSKLIALTLDGVLYDTNVLFQYKVKNKGVILASEYNYRISSSLSVDFEVFSLYDHSRFYKDVKLKEQMKCDIYMEWIKNSQSLEWKKFLTIESNDTVLGYVLYSMDKSNYTIELISVKQGYQNMSLGTRMIDFLKKEAFNNMIANIFVGTQVSNISAINFYIKNGFHVISTTDIYHRWSE